MTDARSGVKRYVVLAAAVVMFLAMGTGQAFSVFDQPLRDGYKLTSAQTQSFFGTSTGVFCIAMIFTGRLHDRFGPRPLGIACAVLMGAAYFIASRSGGDYYILLLSLGVLWGIGGAAGYVCPIATAVKWFPNNKGLICGLAAAGFAGGPILLSVIAERAFRGWGVLDVFGLVAAAYAPVILVTSLLMITPTGPARREWASFRRRTLLGDRRFWTLFVAMFAGTMPFLIVIGKVKPLGIWFGLTPQTAAFAIAVTALGNACGRVFWGCALDRVGHRRAILAAEATMVAAILAMACSSGGPCIFFPAAFLVGFCYGSCFAVLPATVAGEYGSHVLGTVYPLVMVAQSVSSFGPSINGLLFDWTGSYYPGLAVAGCVAAGGLALAAWLSKPAAANVAARPAEEE